VHLCTDTHRMYRVIGESASPDGRIKDYAYPEIPLGYYVGGTLFAFFAAVVCFYWAGFTLVNTVYTHEYTSLNSFNSSRYNWMDWWTVWLLTFNVALPLLFAFALTNNGVGLWARIHKTFAYLVILANLYVLVVLSIQWAFFCNSSNSGRYSACNDYQWCGVYFGQPDGRCSNGAPFIPPITYRDLSRNREMTEHWIYCFVFQVFAVFHIMVNRDFKEYGIFK